MTNEQATRKVIKEELSKLKRSVLASDELAAKLVEYNKAFEAAHREVASLKEQVTHVETEKVESENVFAKVFQDLEQRLLASERPACWSESGIEVDELLGS